MQTATKSQRKAVSLPDNSLAKKAIEAIKQIDDDAKERKLQQLESLPVREGRDS